MALMTLHQYLAREERENSVPHELTTLLLSVADAAKNIRGKVSQGALAGVLGLAGTENVQGEDQKKLDVISNEIMCTANEPCGMLSGLGGAVEIMGNYERFNWIALTQYGFDGLMVAVLARKNPIFIPFGAFLLAYMRIGANVLNVNTSVPIEFVQVMQAVLILFIAAQTFLAKSRNKVIFKAAEKRSAEKEAAK